MRYEARSCKRRKRSRCAGSLSSSRSVYIVPARAGKASPTPPSTPAIAPAPAPAPAAATPHARGPAPRSAAPRSPRPPHCRLGSPQPAPPPVSPKTGQIPPAFAGSSPAVPGSMRRQPPAAAPNRPAGRPPPLGLSGHSYPQLLAPNPVSLSPRCWQVKRIQNNSLAAPQPKGVLKRA